MKIVWDNCQKFKCRWYDCMPRGTNDGMEEYQGCMIIEAANNEVLWHMRNAKKYLIPEDEVPGSCAYALEHTVSGE